MSFKWQMLVVYTALSAVPALARVDLELRPASTRYQPGQTVEIGLYAVSDDASSQVVRGMQVVLQWNPSYLALDPVQPNVNNGPYAWLISGFLPDSGADGLNDTFVDGNAYYQAVGNFSSLAYATPAGLLVTTLRFEALSYVSLTPVEMPMALGLYSQTQVYGLNVGEIVTGDLVAAHINVAPPVEWGVVSLDTEQPVCGLEPGELFKVRVDVSELSAPINGVQVLVRYPSESVVFLGGVPGDAMSSPWIAALEVVEEAGDGLLTYAVLLAGGQSAADATVAELTFRYQPAVIPQALEVQLVPIEGALITSVTLAGTGATIIPDLGPALHASSEGDFDLDGAVDLVDASAAEPCLAGPDLPTCCPECCRLDFEDDGDFDLRDFAGLQVRFDAAP